VRRSVDHASGVLTSQFRTSSAVCRCCRDMKSSVSEGDGDGITGSGASHVCCGVVCSGRPSVDPMR